MHAMLCYPILSYPMLLQLQLRNFRNFRNSLLAFELGCLKPGDWLDCFALLCLLLSGAWEGGHLFPEEFCCRYNWRMANGEWRMVNGESVYIKVKVV